MFKFLSRWAASLAVLMVVAAATPAYAATPAHMCGVVDGVSVQGHCGPAFVDADLSTYLDTSGSKWVRVWGYIYYPQHYNLSLKVRLDIGGVPVYEDSRACASGSQTCTFDAAAPCLSRCVTPGWYWLTVWGKSGSSEVGVDTDREYINCDARP